MIKEKAMETFDEKLRRGMAQQGPHIKAMTGLINILFNKEDIIVEENSEKTRLQDMRSEEDDRWGRLEVADDLITELEKTAETLRKRWESAKKQLYAFDNLAVLIEEAMDAGEEVPDDERLDFDEKLDDAEFCCEEFESAIGDCERILIEGNQ